MKGFNQVVLMGNLTKDPELRTTPNGNQVVSFTLAINSKYGDKEKTDFIDCTAWGKSAETIYTFCSKGNGLLVSGRLDQRTWEQDGQKRSKLEVIVDSFTFIGDKEKTDRSVVTDTQKVPIVGTIEPDGTIKQDEPINLADIPF